jgi:hypothetical protein
MGSGFETLDQDLVFGARIGESCVWVPNLGPDVRGWVRTSDSLGRGFLSPD